ncbi:MAG: nucleoside hydrolase [Alphaproteobacteria bacterium]|nr:nucleoside hydrolase [Alphaproteobacteria bacterium]MBV8409265.1 nucleoside hydrolase [Alphaproteobacteria bacterium]
MAPNRLILDTDGGVDDAQALLLLIANGRAPDAITTVFGNVSLEAATDNILAVLAVAGVDIPVHIGAGEPLAQPRIDARHVHGEDGLGGAPRPERVATAAGTDAVAFLISMLSQAAGAGERVDLLMIGPLTNLALALKQAPRIAAGIGRLTIMGGTLTGRGNVTPAAEFNIFADPEAAGDVFRAALDLTLVPWESCLAHALQGAEIDSMFTAAPDSPYTAFARALVQHDRRRHIRQGLGDCLFLIDPLAAAVVVEPAIVTRSLSASVAVALAPGLTRGMTVVDPSGRLGTPAVTLVEEARIERLASLFTALVGFAPPHHS